MNAGMEKRPGGRRLRETATAILEALLIALVIRSFLYQPFSIPSASMEPTLLVGDYLFVSKFSYGYSRYSLPFSPPLFLGRVLASQPTRGDVVVFRYEPNDFIKRVIGSPASVSSSFMASFLLMEHPQSAIGLRILWAVIPAGLHLPMPHPFG